jgi:hypothetical protein
MEAAGHVGNPLYRENDFIYGDDVSSPFSLTGRKWQFSNVFDCPASMVGQLNAVLEFDGIQTGANVTLNGRPVLSANNQFLKYKVLLPSHLLKSAGNTLVVDMVTTPQLQLTEQGNPNAPCDVHNICPNYRVRVETDAWGWDWSPNLDPISIYKSVRITTAAENEPVLASFSPKITVGNVDRSTNMPLTFVVNTSFEFLSSASSPSAYTGTVTMAGDWGQSTTIKVAVPKPSAAAAAAGGAVQTVVHAVVAARVPDVKLWWPLHYGEPNLHNITATVSWDASASSFVPSTSSAATVTKAIGFRSVGLYTGGAQPLRPVLAAPEHAASFVGCFRDGNIYWGGVQHALQGACMGSVISFCGV